MNDIHGKRQGVTFFALRLMASTGLLTLSLAMPASAEETHGDDHHAIPHSVVSLTVGYALERKRTEDHETLAIGIEYEYRFSEKWGIGGVFETLGEDTIRDVSLVLPVSFHPGAGWRLFAGPGREFSSKDDHWLARFGVGYEFPLGHNWVLAPEAIADVIEGGKRTYIGGIAIGYVF